MCIKILLADDHRILRDGLRSLLAQQPDITVVGEASDGETAVTLARNLQPDLVIMDVVMPGLDGVAATRQIRSACPETKVIALSMHSDRRFVSEMVRAGALGYLVKDSAFEELHQAVKTVMANRPYLSMVITGALVERQPFGGFKLSGIGTKAGGPDYLLQFVIPINITENTFRRGFAPDFIIT